MIDPSPALRQSAYTGILTVYLEEGKAFVYVTSIATVHRYLTTFEGDVFCRRGRQREATCYVTCAHVLVRMPNYIAINHVLFRDVWRTLHTDLPVIQDLVT